MPADAPSSPSPSYEELAGLVAVLASRVDGLEAESTGLRAENAEFRRRLGMNSGNSSTPPSKEPIAAKANARRSAPRTGPPGNVPGTASREAPHCRGVNR